jgi:sugar phosphate isomerase/epimerase
MHFSFCNEGFGERPWPAVCTSLADAGYHGVEVAPFTFANSVQEISARQRAEISEAAHDAGIEVVGLHWLLTKPEGLHISHTDSAVRGRTRDYLCHLVDFCGDLDGRIMVLGSPAQRGRTGGATDEQAWQWAVETLGEVMPTAEERGVTLCIEPLGPDETDFVNTAEDGRRLAREIGHPNFRLMLDVKAMCTEDVPIPEIIRSSQDLLAHVHANDENRQAPGCGDVDFGPILGTLREIGYNGYVSVEPFQFEPDAETVARRSLLYLHECLPAT